MERTLDAEEKTLKLEEDTSTETGESEKDDEGEQEEDTSKKDESEENSDEGSTETVESLKEQLEKERRDKENYRVGMLSAKAKLRGKETDKTEVNELENKSVDVNESAVLKVLSKRAEKEALQNTIDVKHKDYIPELVDDNKYNEIIGYLPRNLDKTSYESIVRGLKTAVKIWKEDRGIESNSPKKDITLGDSKLTTTSPTGKEPAKSFGRFGVKRDSYLDWYKKK